jgi:hypothetical protein
MMINGSVKRAHEETKVMDNKHLLHQQQQQQQVMVVDAGGENVAAETTTTTMRPSKVARHEREVDVKQGGHHHHHHHEQLPPPPLLPVFHHKREIPSLETMTGGGVREATTSTPLQQQQLQGWESKQQIKFVQQEQQVRQFLEERTDERRIERDAQGSGMPDSSNRGLGQEATTTGGSSNGETLIPDLHPTRKSPPVEHEGKKQLWELQEASGENRVESSFFKEEKEKEAAKEREKKDETVVAAAAVRDRNDRKEERVVLHHPPILLLEQKGAERDQREREKAAAAEKEKEKYKVHGNKDWGRDKGKGMSRDKREKRDKEELKDHQGRFVDQEHTHEKKEDINVAVIKEQELSRTQQPAGDHIESQKASVGKEGREGEGEREGEKREDDWDRENKRKRMWESEKDNNRQLGGGGGSPEGGGGGTGGEKHRDNRDTVVNHNVQQRARLLRPRQHSSPAAPRDLLRTYPRVKENDA